MNENVNTYVQYYLSQSFLIRLENNFHLYNLLINVCELISVTIIHRCIHLYERCIVQTTNNIDKYFSIVQSRKSINKIKM